VEYQARDRTIGYVGQARPMLVPGRGVWGAMTKQHSVLVVDDDRDVRALYKDALSECGHSVKLASDGLDALHQLHDGSVPCVVLTDVRMPRMDGWELSRAVAQDPQLASVPVVLLTGDKILSFMSPARDKPYSPIELDAIVQGACELHRPARNGHGAG
jgi:CheY-like chemotaxis protein